VAAELARLDGLGFPEALRWHDGALWFSDMFRSRVVRWTPGAEPETMLDRARGGPEVPGGLGWLPDGSLLVVDCTARRVLRVTDDDVTVHAELGALFAHPANDMHVDADGTAWVGGYGFDPEHDAPRPSRLARVACDGTVALASAELVFPNGCERRPDGALVVAETFADRLSVLTPDGSAVVDRLPLDAGSGPDGLSLAPDGSVFVALAFAGALVKVDLTSTIVSWTPRAAHESAPGPLGCYDCAVHPDGVRIAVAVASADEALAARVDTGFIVLLGL
jgi:sugar lactone lactonase YvrE